jgi:ABC-type amino acid transport substrate-binding protein
VETSPTTKVDAPSPGPVQWQWIALGLAAAFLLILTVAAGVAIYTWGWRTRTQDRHVAEAYATVAAVSLCGPGQVCNVVSLSRISESLWKVRVGGTATGCGLINTESFTIGRNGEAIRGLSPVSCSAASVPLKHPDTLTVGGNIGLYPLLQPPVPPASNPTGVEPDVVRQIASRLGIPNVNWIDSHFLTADALVAKSDFVSGSQLIQSNAPQTEFSAPFLADNYGLLVRNGTSAARTRTLAQAARLRLGAGDARISAFAKETIHPRIAPRTFTSPQVAVIALRKGAVDAVVIDLVIDYSYVGQGIKLAAQLPTGQAFGFAFQKGSPLLPFVNKAIAEMKTGGALKRLTKKWFPRSHGLPLLRP